MMKKNKIAPPKNSSGGPLINSGTKTPAARATSHDEKLQSHANDKTAKNANDTRTFFSIPPERFHRFVRHFILTSYFEQSCRVRVRITSNSRHTQKDLLNNPETLIDCMLRAVSNEIIEITNRNRNKRRDQYDSHVFIHNGKRARLSSNGRTPDFDSGNEGSNPSGRANNSTQMRKIISRDAIKHDQDKIDRESRDMERRKHADDIMNDS